MSFFRFGPQIGYQFSFDSSLNRAYWTLRRTNLSEINGISPRACRTILQSISHRESDTSSRNLVFCFCRLCLISRHFAVCILIQAKEGSKAALFGRRSIYSAYDLASWTSGENLLMVKNWDLFQDKSCLFSTSSYALFHSLSYDLLKREWNREHAEQDMTVEDLCGKATNKEMLRVETGNTQPQYFDQMKNSSDFLNEKIKKRREYHWLNLFQEGSRNCLRQVHFQYSRQLKLLISCHWKISIHKVSIWRIPQLGIEISIILPCFQSGGRGTWGRTKKKLKFAVTLYSWASCKSCFV